MDVQRYIAGVLLSLVALFYGCGSNAGNQGSQSTSQVLPNVLNGQYAFALSGLDASGNPMGIIGSIFADGSGHITSGSVAVNDHFVVSSTNAAMTGTYTLDKNIRGVITLTNTIGSVAQPLAFAFTLRTDGTPGDLISYDNNNFVAAGIIQQQDKTAFSFSALSASSGSFAFEFDSAASGRTSTVGRFTLNANGISSNGLVDVSVAGTGATIVAGPLSITFAASGPDGNGSGSLSVTANGATTNYVYFIINSGKFVLMQTDTNIPNTLSLGVAEKQNFPFSTGTGNTSGSVFALTGFDSSLNNSTSTIGELQVAGSNAATLLWDSNDGGTIFSQKSVAGEPLTFDMMTGRGTVTVGGGSGSGLFDTAVFYLTDSGNGFLLDDSAGQSNRALSGPLQLQSGRGNFSGATLSGNVIARVIGRPNSTSANIDAIDGLISRSISNNIFAVTEVHDGRFLSGPPSLNVTDSFTESFSMDASTGRGTLMFSGNTNALYVVGQDRYVLIDETPPPNNSLRTDFFDPE